MATSHQELIDRFQNDPTYMPPIENDEQPTGQRQRSVTASGSQMKRAESKPAAVFQGHTGIRRPRSVSPLNRETVDKATPLLMLLLGILLMGYSWRGGITTATDIYTFVYGTIASNTPMITGITIQVILTLGQMVCSTKGWWRGYRFFLLPDAASTAWALNRDFLIDMGRAIIARFNAPAFGVYTVMVIASIFIGVFVARKAEAFIIDNYRTLNR